MKSIKIFFLLVLCSSAVVTAQNASPKRYAITDISIVDVEQKCIQRNKTIFVEDGLIRKIVSADSGMPLSDYEVVAGRGLFVIPGLIDSHVHYIDPAGFGPMLISQGVVFMREMGNNTDAAVKERNSLNAGKKFGPEMITTGDYLDGDPPFIPQITLACSSPDEGRANVDKQVKAGVDEIKTYSGLKKDVFLAIIDECRKEGIKAVGHVPETVYIEDAARAGLSSSEHLFGFGNVIAKALGQPFSLKSGGMGADQVYFLSYPKVDSEKLQAELRKIGSYGMAVCPTLVEMKSGASLKKIFAGDYPNLDYVSPFVKGFWKNLWGAQVNNTEIAGQLFPYYKSFLKDLYDAHFTLLVGTDLLFPGVVPGFSVHEEMEIWQEAGIPQIDILRSATIVPARFCGVDKRLGSIEEGKEASFVLLRANPLDDIRNTSKIDGVFFRGQFLDRGRLDTLMVKVKEAAASGH
ncbi:MAG TPA: amidohydrolase family protein [Candidatus Acidoferrales bacterium]|nr:amidohydrolase family protein [Candidatus Acidoferrales bacterium]